MTKSNKFQNLFPVILKVCIILHQVHIIPTVTKSLLFMEKVTTKIGRLVIHICTYILFYVEHDSYQAKLIEYSAQKLLLTSATSLLCKCGIQSLSNKINIIFYLKFPIQKQITKPLTPTILFKSKITKQHTCYQQFLFFRQDIIYQHLIFEILQLSKLEISN